jgi:17beta-estradiol 17-dehydrogenase / very-long-chain 3-oxoacyl-CoA reductase
MVDCNSITVFAAIGAVFLGYKFLGLLKALYDSFVASGIPVCIDIL